MLLWLCVCVPLTQPFSLPSCEVGGGAVRDAKFNAIPIPRHERDVRDVREGVAGSRAIAVTGGEMAIIDWQFKAEHQLIGAAGGAKHFGHEVAADDDEAELIHVRRMAHPTRRGFPPEADVDLLHTGERPEEMPAEIPPGRSAR